MVMDLKIFVSILIIGLVIDYLWVGLIANNFYLVQFGDLARLKANGKFDIVLWAAVVVYILISAGIVFFALPKLLPSDTFWMAAGWGFLFGVIIYGVYDFTNYTTLAKWPVILCVVDVLWGGVLCGLLTGIAKHLRDVIFVQ